MQPLPLHRAPSALVSRRLLAALALWVVTACGVEQPPSERYSTLPFLVSEQYTPSGFMGAGEKPGALTIYNDACPTRPEGALGQCYTFVYDPTVNLEKQWAGVQWQSPPNNWGTLPPKRIEPGATRLRFKLRTSRDANVSVEVGGAPQAVPMPYSDTFHRSGTCKSTTEWTSCELDLSGIEYDHVLNAFMWTYAAKATELEPITLYFDDLIWE